MNTGSIQQRIAIDEVLEWAETTFQLVEGRRVCLTCGVRQYATPSGHTKDCTVGAALELMAKLTEQIP